MKRLINAEHLKGRILNRYDGDWYDIAYIIAIIDSEPTAERNDLRMSTVIALLPAAIFILVAIIVYLSL